MIRKVLVLLLLLAVAAPGAAQVAVAPGSPAMLEKVTALSLRETGGTLFENVASILAARYVDKEFRSKELPALVDRYREQAKAASSLAEERAVVQQLLGHVPASHLGLLSKTGHRQIMADLLQAPYANFGFQLIGAGEHLYAGMILEGGPAARAGLLTGDRIAAIDGAPPRLSPRLDWRTDDAYIGDDRDPAVHFVLAKPDERVELRVERRPGELLTVSVPAEEYTAFDAARASVRIIRSRGRSVGYLHFWYVHITGVPDLIRQALAGPFRDTDGLVIDVRGRGGSAGEVPRIVEVVREYQSSTGRPVVALIDRQSRSGKDILAHEFKQLGVRLVGEATAGAVIPATFADVGHDSVLMFPATRLPKYTDLLEFKPVPPDVPAARPTIYSAGRDEILDAGVAEAFRLIGRR
jgi:C-terminal processing protease CtpA/Prc